MSGERAARSSNGAQGKGEGKGQSQSPCKRPSQSPATRYGQSGNERSRRRQEASQPREGCRPWTTRSVGSWRGDAGGRDPPGVYENRGRRGDHERLLLPQGVQGGWGGRQRQPERRGGASGDAAFWDQRRGLFRVHKCGKECAQEETAEDLLHALQLRKRKSKEEEDPWVFNLEKVATTEGDELHALRARGGDLPPVEEKKGDGKERGEKKSARKEKKKKKVRRRKSDSDQGSSEESREQDLLNGSRPKAAGKKEALALFQGTGLDPREKVRKRVVRKARRHMRKKGVKDHSTGSEETTESESGDDVDMEDESVFQTASKIRVVANGYPGALGAQALAQMRGVLLSEIGSEDKPGMLKGCAVAYFKQCLQRKSSGPSQRELLTIASAVDLMVSGRAAAAVDLLLQRFKSCESSLHGTHWSVAQRQEILAQEGVTLTPGAEMEGARKDVYQESRMRWLASHPDGRGSSSQGKGTTKGKSEKGEDGRKGYGKDRRGGKGGSSPKGDHTRRGKEEAAAPKA